MKFCGVLVFFFKEWHRNLLPRKLIYLAEIYWLEDAMSFSNGSCLGGHINFGTPPKKTEKKHTNFQEQQHSFLFKFHFSTVPVLVIFSFQNLPKQVSLAPLPAASAADSWRATSHLHEGRRNTVPCGKLTLLFPGMYKAL